MQGKTNHEFIFTLAKPGEESNRDSYSTVFEDHEYILRQDITEPQMFEGSDHTTSCCYSEEEKGERESPYIELRVSSKGEDTKPQVNQYRRSKRPKPAPTKKTRK
jgi:hypothetical protein